MFWGENSDLGVLEIGNVLGDNGIKTMQKGTGYLQIVFIINS